MVTSPVRSPETSSVNQTHSYTYDADGNETSYSSGNVSVHYNLLSLPDSVESSIFAGRIRMAYMADGRRMLTQTQTSQTQLLLPMTQRLKFAMATSCFAMVVLLGSIPRAATTHCGTTRCNQLGFVPTPTFRTSLAVCDW